MPADTPASKPRLLAWLRSEESHVFLGLLTLITLFVAQSVYETLVFNKDFLALRLQDRLQLVEIVVAVNIVPALLCFGLWLILRRGGRRASHYFLAMLNTTLFFLFFLQVHKHYLEARDPLLAHSYLLWIIPATLLGLGAVNYASTYRSVILWASPIVLLFPSLFLVRTWDVRPISPATAKPLPQVHDPDRKGPPLFFIVLDELNLDVLLTEEGQLDEQRFPNLTRLAGESYWFPQAWANGDATNRSLPVLLTGDYPLGKSPAYPYYPHNLLRLLGSRYEVYAYESTESRFCEPAHFHCLGAIRGGTAGRLNFLRDTLYLYLAGVVPDGVDLGLPDVRRTWGPFRNARGLIQAHRQRFQKFLGTVARLDRATNVAFIYHHLLPHSPYILDADGIITEAEPDFFDARFKGNVQLLDDLAARYRSQTEYVDKELGRFVEALRAKGLYDQSLLVITSDHGASYLPEAPGRALTEVDGVPVNAELMLRVPLLIKLPFQAQGVVSDREVQHIDLVPTIADILELEMTWKPAGRSVFAPGAGPRPLVVDTQGGRRVEIPPELRGIDPQLVQSGR
jgi:hypothetical protein